MRRGLKPLYVSVAAALFAGLLLSRVPRQTIHSQSSGTPSDVILLDDDAREGPGCDQLAVYDLRRDAWIHTGDAASTRSSPGRTTFDSTFRRFLSVNANHTQMPAFLTLLSRPPRDSDPWTVAWIEGADFLAKGDIAFLDDDRFLVSEGNDELGRSDDHGTVAEYRLSDVVIDRGTRMGSIGPALRLLEMDSLPNLLRLSGDRETLHVLESSGYSDKNMRPSRIRTFDVTTLDEVAAPIPVGRLTEAFGTGPIQALLLPSDRHLLVNTIPASSDFGARQVIKVDLKARTSSLVQVARNDTEMGTVGGMAYNHAQTNHGLIAIHGGDHVRIYRLFAGDTLRYWTSIALPWDDRVSKQSAPWLDLDWSADGRFIVAGVVTDSKQEFGNFAVIRVSNDGRTVAMKGFVTSCENGPGSSGTLPMEVITANSLAPQAARTQASAPTPFPTAPPSATPADICICDSVRRRVPVAVINGAVANPETVDGWMQPLNPNRPVGPSNPRRTCLGLENANLDYHPLFNRPTWLVGCP